MTLVARLSTVSALLALGACAPDSSPDQEAVPDSTPPPAGGATSTPSTSDPSTAGAEPSAPAGGALGGASGGAAGGPTAEPTPVPATAGAGSEPLPVLDPATPFADLPAQCRGLPVLGLTTSPGGLVLPNLCAPFDGTFNNPYAIRCVDADPSYSTGYPGDDTCVLPPPPELGLQVHIGPSQTEPASAFELGAGDEISNHYRINAPNAEPRYYYRTNWRMRPGGHHLLITMLPRDEADGFSAFGDLGSEFGSANQSFGGAQRPSVDRPQGTLEVPPENAGIGQQLAARQQLSFNLHSINTTGAPLLREVWINVWYVDETAVDEPIQTFGATGSPADMTIEPGAHVQREYRCDVASPARLISLYGHYHAHGLRFSARLERASGEVLSIYESFDWADIPVYQFDSVSTNPTPSATLRTDGAISGLLMLAPGDALHFACDIQNDSAETLVFADEALTGEMCILFGAYTGDNPCAAVERVD